MNEWIINGTFVYAMNEPNADLKIIYRMMVLTATTTMMMMMIIQENFNKTSDSSFLLFPTVDKIAIRLLLSKQHISTVC